MTDCIAPHLGDAHRIDTLLTLYMQECGSEMQRLFDRIRSAFIDLYALHMLPELKETGTVPPTYNVWLLNQQRRERLEEAVASAKQVAECIGMAAMGIMDPEVSPCPLFCWQFPAR